MKNSVRIIIALIATLGFQSGIAHHTELPEGMSQARATWLWGHHAIPADITHSGTPYWYAYPHTDVEQITNPAWSDVAKTHIKPGARVPAVLMLHGCSGMTYGTTQYRRYFIGSGYALFEPSSYARPGKKCGEGFYDVSFQQRLEELEHAQLEISKLPWVDQDRVYLMGISEGGRVVAAWGGNGFAGHIIIAAPCGADQDSIPAAPKNTPVLSVIGELDEWAQLSKCRTDGHAAGSKSVVIKGEGHGIPELPEVGTAIGEFLKTVGG